MTHKVKTILPLVGMLLLIGYAMLSIRGIKASARLTSFTGGVFEASGVAGAPGTDGVLFVAVGVEWGCD